MKECTFKPDRPTNKAATSNNPPTEATQGPAKYEQLYALSKVPKNKQDKTKEDYEWERNKEELTFAPKIFTNEVPPRNKE